MLNIAYTLIIPTYNAGKHWQDCIDGIGSQSLQPEKVIVIDSTSQDNTVDQAQKAGFDVILIKAEDFDHGGTRTFALDHVQTDFVVFLTQDALLANKHSIENLLKPFSCSSIGGVYGRQLPHKDATPLALHARVRNYGAESYITDISSDNPKGFRKAFFSNSFAAYRLSALRKVGSFPERLILGEDTYVAAQMLLSSIKIAYQSHALVYHSHNYTTREEFKRYFDIGVFHSQHSWILKSFGDVEGEGIKFVVDQTRFLLKERKWKWLLPSLSGSLAKYCAYKLGKSHSKLNQKLCKLFSMHKSYWD